MIQKRFPADTTLEVSTFLNDKKIDGELYAYFQSMSKPQDGETRVYFSSLPVQSKICKKIGIKSPKTYRVHLDYLIEKGYIVKESDYYVLNNKENIFLMIPLDTLQFLLDTTKENIIKIYVYLAQRYKYAQSQGKNSYEFSLKELAQHTGVKLEGHSRGYEILDNSLNLLYDIGLIDYCSFYDGNVAKKKLTFLSFEYKKKQDN